MDGEEEHGGWEACLPVGQGLPQHFLALFIDENRACLGVVPIKVEEGKLQGKMGSSRVMEEEGVWGERSKECHGSFRRETPAGEAKAFSLCGDRGNGDVPHFSAFPYRRHTHVHRIIRITNFEKTRVRCFFDRQ